MDIFVTITVAILVRAAAYLLAQFIWTEIASSKAYSKRLIKKSMDVAKETLSDIKET